jgi:hypothetical protein
LTRWWAKPKLNPTPDIDGLNSVVLELISVLNKDVLCLVKSDNLLKALKERGARVVENIVLQHQLPFFDVVIYDDYSKVCITDILATKSSTFLFLVPGRIFSVKFVMMRVLLRRANYKVTTYSIFPSFSDVKLIIPDGIPISARRYWSLWADGPCLTVKSVLLWFLFKWNATRVLSSKKVIIFYVCSGNTSE